MSDGHRYARGLDLLEAVQGPQGTAAIRASFDAISPDFGPYVIDAGFADVYGRCGLSLTQRQLLNVGVSPTELIETIFFPTPLSADTPDTPSTVRQSKTEH